MKQLSILIVSFFLSICLYGQGVLKGRIVDAKTKTPMEGVEIFIIGTYFGGYSDAEGNYEIQEVTEGDYTIRFTILNYSEKEYTGISIRNNETRVLDIEMGESIESMGEVVIVGEKNLIDLESGKSQVKITDEQISQMNVTNIQGIVAQQVGVNQTPDGIQIRGARVYETQYVVDGINAQDPLAGTGFGVDVNAGAVSSIDVITGGSDAEFGNGSSGVVSARIKEGSNQFQVAGQYYRDNLGFKINEGVSWNTDQANVALSGPLVKNKLFFFVNAGANLSDNYFRVYARQLHSSMFTNDSLWAPRQDNQWNNTIKLTWKVSNAFKISLTNQKSLNINQNNRTLQVVGNNAIMQPGLQYIFAEQPDNANTFTHNSNLSVLNIRGLINEQWTLDGSVARLFTGLRADANGRAFRNPTVDQVYDPFSIVTAPVSAFNPNDSVVYVYPGSGFINNNGIATLWHDHYAEEYTLKTKFSYQSKNKVHYMTLGQEHIFQEYQWIDVTRPWVGAPIQINDSVTTPSTSLGSSSDLWKVNPQNGGFFYQDEIRYKGIIAVLGARLNYWAPGKFTDEAVKNPEAPVLDKIREDYQKQTFGLMGLRWKARILPRLRVSFPISANNVLYFNYSHAMRLPHPRFVYAGLDPVYQDRSFLSNLGNPNLNPEVTVSYELGVKSQLTKDLALTATAFYNDKFDYIVSRRIIVKDQTGRFVEKTFFINQDYARVQGLELSVTRRLGKWFMGTLSGSYTQAKGKSNSAAESALQIQQQGFVNTTKEQYLAWDRPFDLKMLLIFKGDSSISLGKIRLNGWRAMLSSTWKSGLRYTPTVQTGVSDAGRPVYEMVENEPFSKIGSSWFWTDVRISKDVPLGRNRFISFSARMDNVFNYKSAAILNPVTGKGYEYGDPLPLGTRDPKYPDPQDTGTPPLNPARYLQPAHFMLGIEFKY